MVVFHPLGREHMAAIARDPAHALAQPLARTRSRHGDHTGGGGAAGGAGLRPGVRRAAAQAGDPAQHRETLSRRSCWQGATRPGTTIVVGVSGERYTFHAEGELSDRRGIARAQECGDRRSLPQVRPRSWIFIQLFGYTPATEVTDVSPQTPQPQSLPLFDVPVVETDATGGGSAPRQGERRHDGALRADPPPRGSTPVVAGHSAHPEPLARAGAHGAVSSADTWWRCCGRADRSDGRSVTVTLVWGSPPRYTPGPPSSHGRPLCFPADDEFPADDQENVCSPSPVTARGFCLRRRRCRKRCCRSSISRSCSTRWRRRWRRGSPISASSPAAANGRSRITSDVSYELEHQIAGTGSEKLLGGVRELIDQCTFSYTRQVTMKGLGHAILTGRTIVGDEPFGVVLADDLCFGEGTGVLAQMVKLFRQFSLQHRRDRGSAEARGRTSTAIIEGQALSDSLVRVTDNGGEAAAGSCARPISRSSGVTS